MAAQRIGAVKRTGRDSEVQNVLRTVHDHCAKAKSLAGQSEDVQAAIYNSLGIAHIKAGNVDQGVTELMMAIRLKPGYPIAYVHLADAYMPGHPDEAIKWLELALTINPAYEYAHLKLGDVYFLQEDTELAKQEYQKAPRLADAHNKLGEMVAQEGRYENALAEFQKAIELNSRHSRAYSNFAWYCAEADVKDEHALKQATEYARRAIQLERGTSREWRMQDVLGYVYLKRGLLDDAEREFRSSLEKNTKQMQNRYHLALLHYMRGRLDKARHEIEALLQLKQGGYWRDKAEELMQRLQQT